MEQQDCYLRGAEHMFIAPMVRLGS